MVTLLITSTAILFILAIGLYFWQKPRTQPDRQLPPYPTPRALFEAEVTAGSENQASDDEQQKRLEILERAGNGDNQSLQDAQGVGDRNFYDEALERLTSAI